MSQKLTIQEKGITAYEFQKDSMLTNNDLMIINRFELNFFKNFECSTQTNLPVPMKNEVYYFESKIYSLPHPEDTLISIGLSIKPYPWFRLPGRHAHSICYDSDGYRRYNQPFKFTNDPPFPKLAQGDVVGVGYKTRSGTVFFTRNGKKVSESRIGGHVKNFKIANFGQLFPTVGANNLCSIHVNLGQRGFVFIEGNVKSWGYAPIEGNGPAPPAYRKFNSDILLERSEVDDDNNDLSEREDDFPPDFWEVHGDPDRMESSSPPLIDQDKFSYNAYSDVESNAERITLNSLVPPNTPPAYNEELSIGSSQEVITEQEDEVETNASAQSATESEESEIPDDHSDSRLYEEETEDMEMEFTPEVETTAAGECQDETREDIEEQQ
ncbi:uncharacterized protein SPAPADRAFT_58627 [Spathaspora passalidarum NRRL Y-27907]|uniref:B30.2/SPRY domain-containing protein n=1 Tax=Spathaspora passalidarum (strain NRRL Y-27907 / 11-Y1) TaxID=619300 RepID=G3AGS6_SPAPN|nr:uncharacterized protein SPAPADRAFT_58627 [Spathaspora passalidarum NRRL Y-27907]EGW35409.1 hypothetical protein SPAPADRAFT_58627 [Spathaspora passalidarum NRRL Y-27907]